MDRKKIVYVVGMVILWLGLFTACGGKEKPAVSLESLLNEMVSWEEAARYPVIPYRCLQMSSYDRLSVSPDSAHWFANNDGFGFERIETNEDGHTEKVLFDDEGPGVITRIWTTTTDKRGTWRFYFDGSPKASWEIPVYDMMQIHIPQLGRGLLQPHTSYTLGGKGGSTLFLPIPYGKGCKITFEEPRDMPPTPRYYQINYRKYPEETIIETFTSKVAKKAASKIEATDKLLQNPVVDRDSMYIEREQELEAGNPMLIKLPQGGYAVRELKIKVSVDDKEQYAQIMRNIILMGTFDGRQTVWVPISDFSGGGMGAPAVESWFLSADGNGSITSRWPMPYREAASIALVNEGKLSANIEVSLRLSPVRWDERMLYFYASWRQERGIKLSNNPDDNENTIDWNFATINGKGVYKGDVLTLYNHSLEWYGEGDEKIWVDDDKFPSHFGTGTEDYYNSSWAPVIPFQTPFGGAPRTDLESSHGYNTFFRTRNLDGIPFTQRLKFDIEMLGWKKGSVDYATTLFWYGNIKARAEETSGVDEATVKLLPASGATMSE
jgi:hypothetical protein